MEKFYISSPIIKREALLLQQVATNIYNVRKSVSNVSEELTSIGLGEVEPNILAIQNVLYKEKSLMELLSDMLLEIVDRYNEAENSIINNTITNNTENVYRNPKVNKPNWGWKADNWMNPRLRYATSMTVFGKSLPVRVPGISIEDYYGTDVGTNQSATEEVHDQSDNNSEGLKRNMEYGTNSVRFDASNLASVAYERGRLSPNDDIAFVLIGEECEMQAGIGWDDTQKGAYFTHSYTESKAKIENSTTGLPINFYASVGVAPVEVQEVLGIEGGLYNKEGEISPHFVIGAYGAIAGPQYEIVAGVDVGNLGIRIGKSDGLAKAAGGYIMYQDRTLKAHFMDTDFTVTLERNKAEWKAAGRNRGAIDLHRQSR